MRSPTLSTPLDGGFVHPIRTDADLDDYRRWTDNRTTVAVDTETEGLGFHDPVRLVQVSDGTDAWVFDPMEHPDLVAALVDGDQTLIAHNSAFDGCALGRVVAAHYAGGAPVTPEMLGSEVEAVVARMVDTMVLAHLVDPRSEQDGGRGHGLKALCDHYLGAGAIDSQSALKERFRSLGLSMKDGFARIPLWDQTFVVYAGVDALLAFRLHEVLAPKVDELGLTALARFEHEVASICAGMTARGIRVDLEHARATLEHLDEERVAAERQASLYGVDNCNSTRQVAEALLVRGVELTEKTDSGLWRVDKSVLATIDDPVAHAVQAAKAAGKAASSWVEPIIEQAEIDGRVHPRIRTVGAKTGRMSVNNPAVQQLPTSDWRIRSCLIADEHQSIVCADLSQVEPRVAAHLAGEKRLIDAFRGGVDIYNTVAANLYGKDFPPERRALAKGAVLAKMYGASPKRLAVQTGVTEVVAKQAMGALDRAYPRLARWSATTIDRARWNGGVATTSSGRRLPVLRGSEYKLVNHLVQSAAADLLKGAIVNMARAGYADRMLMAVHDELIVQADSQVAAEFGQIVADLMSGQLGDVPIVAEHKVAGPSWGHAYREDA